MRSCRVSAYVRPSIFSNIGSRTVPAGVACVVVMRSLPFCSVAPDSVWLPRGLWAPTDFGVRSLVGADSIWLALGIGRRWSSGVRVSLGRRYLDGIRFRYGRRLLVGIRFRVGRLDFGDRS